MPGHVANHCKSGSSETRRGGATELCAERGYAQIGASGEVLGYAAGHGTHICGYNRMRTCMYVWDNMWTLITGYVYNVIVVHTHN